MTFKLIVQNTNLGTGCEIALGRIMMTSSNGKISRVTGPLCGEFTGHRRIPRTKASEAELWCFLWSALNNSWADNGDAGGLRRNRTHYDVIVMMTQNLTNEKSTLVGVLLCNLTGICSGIGYLNQLWLIVRCTFQNKLLNKIFKICIFINDRRFRWNCRLHTCHFNVITVIKTIQQLR